MDQRYGFSRFAIQSTLGTVLPAVLAMAVPLQAQSPQNLISGLQEPRVRSELRDKSIRRAPEIGPDFDPREISTAPAVQGAPQTAISKSLAPSTTYHPGSFSDPERSQQPVEPPYALGAESDGPDENSKSPSVEMVRPPKLPDFNQSIYYKNRLEFGLDVGWLPINIPFVFDVFLGDGYTMTPLKYTLLPVIASLRWHMDNVSGPSFLRGNWDLSTSGAVVAIPRGPETRYYSWIMGIRRNFVQRNWRVAPYFDGRLGLGNIDAKEPKGVVWAQGEDFTFTLNLGAGVRYNFNPRYSLSAGMNYMHISNLYLSEPRYPNYGINVYGPMFGIDIRLGKPRRGTSPY